MPKFYCCFFKAGNSTDLFHIEVVVRLCARAGLSEHSVPAATSALRMLWQNATLLNYKSPRLQLNEDCQIELEFFLLDAIGGLGGRDGTPAHKKSPTAP
jgi:hypothetical protein